MQGQHQTIYCIGRNYLEHARELGNTTPVGEPIVFLKSPGALRALRAGPLAFVGETFHHEAEIVVRLGRSVALGNEGSWDDVDALALGLDLTRREVQTRLKEKGLPWTTAKSFAGAAPISDFVPKSAFPDRSSITFTLTVNGELRQQGDSRAMMFSIPSLLTHLATYHSLQAGDLIFTGTPAGVGAIKRGDHFELSFSQIKRSFAGCL